MELDPRSSAILQPVVAAYIGAAEPVSSAVVAQRGQALSLSPATIRSVMAELEAQGLLFQPHTSAGRIPTGKGLRHYVDSLLDPRLRPRDRSQLEAAANASAPAQLPTNLGQSLAGLSGQVAVIAVPRFVGSRFQEVGLVRHDSRRFLAFFVSAGGLVQQAMVEVDFDLTAADLQEAQNFLNEKLRDHTVDELRLQIRAELEGQQSAYDHVARQVLAIGVHALPESEARRQLDLFVEGASHLVGQPEFADLRRLRDLLEAIEERTALLEILERVLDAPAVKVILSFEHRVRALPDLACVGASWVAPSGAIAAVTLLGPLRMDYGRLVPLVGYTTKLLERRFEHI